MTAISELPADWTIPRSYCLSPAIENAAAQLRVETPSVVTLKAVSSLTPVQVVIGLQRRYGLFVSCAAATFDACEAEGEVVPVVDRLGDGLANAAPMASWYRLMRRTLRTAAQGADTIAFLANPATELGADGGYWWVRTLTT